MFVLGGASAISLAAAATGMGAYADASGASGTPEAPLSSQQTLQPRPPAPVFSPISASVSRWNSLRQTDSLPFSSYASFLVAHRGWPGEAAMRRTAEKAIDPNGSSAAEVVAYFRIHPPLTPTGYAKQAFALLSLGQMEEARAAARRAWQGGAMAQADEGRLLSLFGGAFSQSDHDLRMEDLLANADTQSARRMVAYVSSASRPVFEARLAMQTRAGDAASRSALLSGVEGDPGYLMDRANWLRNTGQSLAGRQLLAMRRPLTRQPVNAETWFETLLTMARAAANDRQYSGAYQIASRLDDAYPAGTDVSDRPFAERDHYTSLAWLAGTTALHQLARPADAMRMFDLYARAARSPQTRSKGFYWAARAANAAGQAAQSSAYLEQAAANPDQFYGQLALERLGRLPAPPMQTPIPAAAERAAFAARPLAQATRFLGQTGQWSDQTLFIRALAQQLESDQDRALAGDFALQIGRSDLGVWIAREARSKGSNFYARSGFPTVAVAPGYARLWTLDHAIMRQESSFDRAAVSHAGARGMMQLMPGTARETAGKLGLPYDYGRLTSDPSYNIMLGSAYFSNLLDIWGGNAALAVASYNAGAGNVRRWIRENGDPRLPGADMVRWIEAIPFQETRNYVQRVLENAVVYDMLNPQMRGAPPRNRLSAYLGKSNPG